MIIKQRVQALKQAYENLQATANKDFIPLNQVFTSEDLKLMASLPSVLRPLLLRTSPSEQTQHYRFTLELTCPVCGQKETLTSVSKTDLLEKLSQIAKGKEFFLCGKCLATQRKRDAEIAAAERIDQETQIEERTTRYLLSICNPTHRWKEGVSLYKKIKQVQEAIFLNEDKIAKYLQSLDYSDFLQTPYWHAIRLKVMKKFGFACALCNSKDDLRVHHRTYEHHGYEHRYWDTDLICLCNDCHSEFHECEEDLL